ncbi:MAG TPA: hypothetical protein DCY13_23115 [Verrucomicrobiales bacterium]|nr:hypothetical protein [Verrucomicrobiales bacterium]
MNAVCPTPATWRALLSGAVPEAEQVELAGHLDTCEPCRQLLEQLSGHGTTTFVFAERDDSRNESIELRRLVSRLKGVEGAAGEGIDWDIAPYLQPSAGSEAIGTFGGYEVLEIVARGGMGIVLKAHDRQLDRVVAVKVLAPHLAANIEFRERFLREARAAAALQHDHVVVIHSVGEEAGLPFIVMQHLAGPSLQAWLDTHGRLGESEVIRVGRQLASALVAAHAVGLIHRDIKPANILLEDGLARVRLTDFGLVHSVNQTNTTDGHLLAGTPQFMSPEQAAGAPVGVASDLFSLGGTLYSLAIGHPPFVADRMTELLAKVRKGIVEPIRRERSELSAGLAGLIGRLMSPDPTRRGTAAETLATFRKLARPKKANLVVWTTAAAALLAVLVGIVWPDPHPNAGDANRPVGFTLRSGGTIASSLAEAVELATPGDLIEVHGDGLIEVQPLTVRGKPLRIRNAVGARPVLRCVSSDAPMFDTDSALTLEGLVLEHQLPNVLAPPLIRITGASLRLWHCRMQKRSLVPRAYRQRAFCVEANDAPLVEIAYSELIPVERAVGLVLQNVTSDRRPVEPFAAEVRIMQSLMFGMETCEVENRTAEPVRLTIEDSVFINRLLLRLDDLAPANSVEVRIKDSVIEVDSVIFGFALEAQYILTNLNWSGDNNRYRVQQAFINLPTSQGRPAPAPGTPRTVVDWDGLAEVEETGSRMMPAGLRAVFMDALLTQEDLTANKLEIEAMLADMPSPPEIVRMGPGKPYEDWRASPAYVIWEAAIRPDHAVSPPK